eukprot:TRINITY_DN2495_c0_g2_i1.p1 TRINITY_DN2495_c0_g2~~TRINITY_DN2495_c0_g2_i1.p1  ORF type:complete len:760 (+),score=183.32 TRINITY_DN2495_c0_g2_i1:36-2315(+)
MASMECFKIREGQLVAHRCLCGKLVLARVVSIFAEDTCCELICEVDDNECTCKQQRRSWVKLDDLAKLQHHVPLQEFLMRPDVPLPQHLELGITVQAFREVLRYWPPDAVDLVNRVNQVHNPEYPHNECLNGYVNQFFCTQEEQIDKLSMCERLEKQGSPHVGKANVFVSWALSASLNDLAEALENFLKDSERPMDATFFWICDLTIHHTDVMSDLRWLERSIKQIGCTVLFLEPWNAPVPLRRAYCVKEIYSTQKHGAQFAFALTQAQKCSFQKALVEQFDSISTSLARVDLRKADCRKEEDKEQILNELESVGAIECNQKVIPTLANALVEEGKAALDLIPCDERTTSALFGRVGFLLVHLGQLDAARAMLQDSYDSTCKLRGKCHPDSIASMVVLGELLLQKGDLHEAEPLLRDMLALSREVNGKRHPHTLTAMGLFGQLRRQKGELHEAEPLLRDRLDLSREVNGERHPDTLVAMDDLGQVLLQKGDLHDAELLLRDMLELSREVRGERHPNTLVSMGDLGQVLLQKGDLHEAEPLLRDTVELSREVCGVRHPNTLGAVGDLCQLLRWKGDIHEAELLLRGMLELSREVNGERHPNTLAAMGELGQLLCEKGELHLAEPLLRDTLELSRKVRGERHPNTLGAMGVLSVLLCEKGDLSQAEPLLRQRLKLSREVRGERHPNTLAAMGDLGQVLLQKGDLHEAEPMLRELLDLSHEVCGEQHPITLDCKENLGKVLCKKRELDKANRLPREAQACGH